MKELCIDIRMAFSSGIGTYIRNLITGLKAGPFKLRLIADPTTLERWPLLSTFDLILCRAPIYSIEEQIRLPLLIPTCDLFWSPHYNVPLLPIRAKKRMVTIHDVYHLAHRDKLSLPKRLYANLLIPQAAKRSDRVITVSQFSKNELLNYVALAEESVEVISLGVDRTHFCPRNGHKQEKYLLFVGNLSPHKNIQGLLHSLSYLKDKTWKVVVVGAKTRGHIPLKDPFGQAVFLENVETEELPALYRGAYALVHPSFYEGFGLTPLEAMSCGCPVIASNAASLPEVCGDAALYIDPHRPESIAKAIEELAPIRETMIAKGLERANQFGWDKTIERHIQIIESL